ncbi:hypothetical protein D6T63_15355 [Arthrobacter cheniae]|jgi:hypothetical protein|uniref:Uncharacterized protein n=1 Tax=Arthrobacter cheniae TaxID=1258888 RepID=A0A3A5M7Z6_9MICC|nr:hypothetical protein [Arthrobacter cheniae]RJT77312.1 hypothetical protein D6T63_15355 [Arthrobacter cheniae]
MAGNLLARSAHDLGAAAWFGGTLMGAVGLNGATGKAKDPKERTRLSALGWAKWTPVQVAAFAVHAAGGIGLILGNKGRVAAQDSVGSNTVWKSLVTVLGMALSLYSGMLGKKVGELAEQGGEGATEPRPGASDELAKAQSQLKATQWLIPLVSGIVVVMGAKQGEMQRPENVKKGLFKK